MTLKVHTASAEETKAWGERLARLLFPSAIVGLEGELGAGKTCFVKGLATGLAIAEDEISSPTFTLVAEHYRGRVPLYHIDLYRLEGAEVEELGLDEYLFGRGVTAIEWFRFLPAGTVDEYLLVSFTFVSAEERELIMTARGEKYERVLEALMEGEQRSGVGDRE